MKGIFESDEEMEIKRLSKSKDMALCLWEIVHNGWRETECEESDELWDRIMQIISDHNIDVDDLIE